jgi:hypothetical protein
MSVLKHAVVVLGLILPATFVMAQPPKPKPKAVTAQKPKLPKLKTALGNRSDSAVNVTVDEATQLILLPLTITDDKKGMYSISTYECMYRRKGVTENEESGKVSPITSIVVEQFKTTPLSEIWKKTITEQLQPGEEISFYDIVVKDAQGRLMFAPNLKLVVK